MSCLGDVFGIQVRNGELYGVEVETEGANLPTVQIPGWKAERDGSLRGEFPDSAAEYVLRTPSSLDGTMRAVKNLEAALANSVVKMSHRCSVHVHLNVSDLTHDKLCSIFYLYSLVEPVFNECVAESRRGNRFCQRLIDAEASFNVLASCAREPLNTWVLFINNEYRYSAFNLASLRKYGTIEFRALQGTANSQEIGGWLMMISALYRTAMKYASPLEIEKEVEAKGIVQFVKDIFPFNNVEEHTLKLYHCLAIPILGMFVRMDAPAKNFVLPVRNVQPARRKLPVRPVPVFFDDLRPVDDYGRDQF